MKMISGRPLLYLSMPGIAFILGMFWFRRRNRNRISDSSFKVKAKKELDSKNEVGKSSNQNNRTIPEKKFIPTPTESININGTSLDKDNSATKLFCKSAPIQIVQNCKSSPMKQSPEQQIDTELLKVKNHDSELKVLRSIDEDFENLSSPIDLPDSVSNRVSIYSRNIAHAKGEPVVIKATRTPKISPENSFFESKHVKDCEQNINFELNSSSVEEKPIKTEDSQKRKEMKKEINSNKSENDNINAASPSLSLCSIQSGDSGKGSSLPRSEAMRAKTTYEFFFPNSLIGHLYGRKRSFINQINSKTSAKVGLSKNRYAGKVRICVVEGTESEIKAALEMIRQRLPAKHYPNFTMHRIHFALPQTIVPLSTESLLNLQLNLIEGINNDVVVSAVITGGHIFVQHPLHPSHPSLAVLQKCLYDSYTRTEAPLLPGIEINAVCVLAVKGIWYRVQIVEQDVENNQRCIVKFLDFGGYMNVHVDELRQIRSDFMSVPFQATECILSNIVPIDSCWYPETTDILCKLTKGIVVQAQVAGYNSHDIPEIYLFACLGPNNVIYINKELVGRNLARWVEVKG